MSLLAATIVDWGALLDVAIVSAVAGLAIALTLGVGVASSLRAQEREGVSALVLNAVTVTSVVLVGIAVLVGLHYLADK
jgi:predicted benzoate:H+ symporter BenE